MGKGKKRLAGKFELKRISGAEAIETLTEAASHGNPSAALMLAEIYIRGLGGVVRDNEKAIYWVTIALKADPKALAKWIIERLEREPRVA